MPIMDLTKKERRQLRRKERRQTQLSSARGRKTKTLVIWAAIILVAAGLAYWGYYYFVRISQIPEIGEAMPVEGANHVAEGTKVEYKANPPASGDHYGVPANWGVYDHEIPDEAAVHNLEHGGVWINYKPEIPETAKEKLIEIAKSGSKIILTPRSKNDSLIAVVSWGRIYKTESFNEETIRNFVLKYENTGPEGKVPKSMPGKDY